MDPEQAREYLSGILNKNLRVYTTDGRLFWGALKCTDPVCLSEPLQLVRHGIDIWLTFCV